MQDILKVKDVLKLGLRGFKEASDYNWHGKMISIKYMISKEEVFELMRRVEKMCTTENGEFSPEFLDFAIKTGIVTYYAIIELPTDVDELYKLIYHSDIYDVVLNNANKKQIDSVVNFFEPWR